MATAAEPNNNVMTLQGTPVSAQSVAGADYVRKVIHPPTTIPAGYSGIPDASQPNFVPLEVKCEMNIQSTYTQAINLVATAPVFPTNGRILLMGPTGGHCANYVFYWTGNAWIHAGNQIVSGAGPTITSNLPGTTFSGYDFSNFHRDISSFRTVYKSSTFYLNATEFNNQGTVTSAKFKPDLFRSTLEALTARMSTIELAAFDAELVRLAKNLSKDPEDDIEVIDVKGRKTERKLTFADFPAKIRETVYKFEVLLFDAAGTTSISNPTFNPGSYLIKGQALPNTPADVLTMSPKGTMRMARDGSFVVHQPIESVQPWTNTQGSLQAIATDPTDLNVTYLRTFNGATYEYTPLSCGTGFVNTVGAVPYCDVAWNNLDWHFTMFDGLSEPTFNASGIPINAPYITDKSFLGIEGNARQTGSLTSFQKLLPMPDPEALQMATGIFHARPDSLPASANDLASMAAVAAKWLPTAVSWLKNVFSKGKNQPAPVQSRAPRQRAVQQNFQGNIVRNRGNRGLGRRRPAGQNNMVRKEQAELQQTAALNAKVNRLTVMLQNMSAPAATPRAFTNSTAFGAIQRLAPKPQRARFNPSAVNPSPRTRRNFAGRLVPVV